MEAHRHGPRGSQDDLFGVQVRVQGIKGQPFVVLNTSSQESHRDVSIISHQAGYDPGVARGSADERLDTSPPVFHYQKHPELLRPYDPNSNNLSYVIPPATCTSLPPDQPKPRIPLPAEGPHGEPTSAMTPFMSQAPPRSPNSVDTDSFVSVGQLISQFNSSQRRGRGGPRNRLDPEQCRRSRSVDSSRTSDSSSSSAASSRASSLKVTRGEVPTGGYPPGSARARLLGGHVAAAAPLREAEKFKGHNGREEPLKNFQRAKTPPALSSCGHQAHADDREAQVGVKRGRVFSKSVFTATGCVFSLSR